MTATHIDRSVPYAENLVVPEGHFAITLDIEGLSQTSAVIPQDRLDDILSAMAKDVADHRAVYTEAVSMVAWQLMLAQDARGRQPGRAQYACTLGVWAVFNHPTAGDHARQGYTVQLQKSGRPHITLRLNQRGTLAVAIGDRFENLSDILDGAPRGKVTILGEDELAEFMGKRQ